MVMWSESGQRVILQVCKGYVDSFSIQSLVFVPVVTEKKTQKKKIKVNLFFQILLQYGSCYDYL